VKLAG